MSTDAQQVREWPVRVRMGDLDEQTVGMVHATTAEETRAQLAEVLRAVADEIDGRASTATTVPQRVAELAQGSLGQPMARRIDNLCQMLAESEARHQMAEAELVTVRSAHAAEWREVNGLLREARGHVERLREDLRLANGGYDLDQTPADTATEARP
jgi:hypothetical protein